MSVFSWFHAHRPVIRAPKEFCKKCLNLHVILDQYVSKGAGTGASWHTLITEQATIGTYFNMEGVEDIGR